MKRSSWCGVDVLGDQTAGHATPAEPEEILVAVLSYGRELDPLAGGGVKEGPEAGHRPVSLMGALILADEVPGAGRLLAFPGTMPHAAR